MLKMTKKTLLIGLWAFVAQTTIAWTAEPTPMHARMIDQLDLIKTVFEVNYAPAGWKKSFSGWELEKEMDRAKEQVLALPTPRTKDFRRIVREFFQSTQDYHVGISFFSTEEASLPFSVRSAGDRIFLAYIDREKLPESSFPFRVGDELVEFGGTPAVEALNSVLRESGYRNVPTTDKMIAELQFTQRSAAQGFTVPKGPIVIGVRPQGTGRVFKRELIWTYSPERISTGPFARVADARSEASQLARNILALGSDMTTPFVDSSAAAGGSSDPYRMASRKSFLPDLGKKLWESDPTSSFHAYLYMDRDRKLIGYVRIPTYMPEDVNKAVADFAAIIAKFEPITDSLVIDQVNNPGGSIFYLYTLASMLTDQALYTPRHRFAIQPEMVAQAVRVMDQLNTIKTDEEAKKAIGPTFEGYPTSYQLVRHLVEYSRFIVDEWNAGRSLTEPYFVWGIDQINPFPIHYTKPILLLVNGLDFSGGDFFPAILQDNKRATVFGTRTSGAGGYVRKLSIPNSFGIESFSTTASIAWRIDQNPIENLGVTPDISYDVSASDLQNGYRDYVMAIEKALKNIQSAPAL